MSGDVVGSCVCGTVQFSIRPPFRFFQYCHCTRCRKRSGSAHAANIAIAAEQLAFRAGEDAVLRFELPTAERWCNAFCRHCGSAAPWRTRNGKFAIVPAGSLDDDPQLRPERNIHVASGAAWYRPAADLPHFDAEPPVL